MIYLGCFRRLRHSRWCLSSEGSISGDERGRCKSILKSPFHSSNTPYFCNLLPGKLFFFNTTFQGELIFQCHLFILTKRNDHTISKVSFLGQRRRVIVKAMCSPGINRRGSYFPMSVVQHVVGPGGGGGGGGVNHGNTVSSASLKEHHVSNFQLAVFVDKSALHSRLTTCVDVLAVGHSSANQ